MAQVIMIRLSHARDSWTFRSFLEKFIISSIQRIRNKA